MILNCMSRYLLETVLKVDLRKCTRCLTVSTSSLDLNAKMKQLVYSQQYKQAVNLFNSQSSSSYNDITLTLALKACAKLKDYNCGVQIHQKLSSKSLENPFIQTSLIHFYSKSLFY